MSPKLGSILLRFAIAVASVVVAAAVRVLLAPVVGDTAVYPPFMVAVAVTALRGGFWPSLTAVVLSGVAVVHLFISPYGALAIESPETIPGLAVFLAAGAILAVVSGLLQRSRNVAERLVQEAVEQRESFRVTLASIGDAVIVADTGERVTFMNPVAEWLTGWSIDEARGRPVSEVFAIVHEHTRQPAVNPMKSAMNEGAIASLAEHTMLIDRHGAERAIDDSAAPIRHADGAVTGAVLVFRDVTDSRASQEAVKSNEERLRLALEAGRMGAWEWNIADGQVIWSPALERIHGLKPGQFGGTFEDFQRDIHPDDRNYVLGAVRNSVESTGEHHIEYRLVRPDGEIRWVEARGKLMRDRQGRPERMIGVCADVTARKQAEQAVDELNDELRESSRRKDEFLAMLGHELRNPLAPIRSGLDVLELGARDEETILLMKGQLAHLVRLVDDLLDVSRIMRGRIELRKEPVELSAVIERAIEACRPQIGERGQSLAVKAPAEPIWLDADPVRLTQVVCNLLQNASKYSDAGGHIELEASRSDGVAEIAVRDNGVGIAAEILPRVFDLFVQAESTKGRAQGGLGVGLTLVRRLVELHGGYVTAASEGVGAGSRFTVRLPAAAPHKVAEASPPVESSSTPRKVMIVDDNADAARLLSMLLASDGDHEIRTAYAGEPALALAESFRPEVVLLDIGLPDMSGYEVAQRLRATPHGDRMYLAALTGYGQPEDRRRAREAGFDCHLVKPIDTATILTLVRTASRPREVSAGVDASALSSQEA
jgi:PAS domain S-box-containing protein